MDLVVIFCTIIAIVITLYLFITTPKKEAPEKQHEKAPEKQHEKAPEKQHEKAPEKQHEKAPEKQHEKAPEKQHEKAPEKQHEKASDYPVESHQSSNLTSDQMNKLHRLLQDYKLQRFYKAFLDFGVRDEMDFIDGITDDSLMHMGLTQVERTRFGRMQNHIKRLGITGAPLRDQMPVKKSLKTFSLMYLFPKCDGPKELLGMDPTQNTMEDVMLRIQHQENIDNTMAVCLFTADGMPLTDDPFFNMWSLEERHIENGSTLYVIFTPKENLKSIPKRPSPLPEDSTGADVVHCHIMQKGNFEIKVDFESDTLLKLRTRLAAESGIPPHVLHLRNMEWDISITLEDLGITEESVLIFSLSSFDKEHPVRDLLFQSDVTPSIQQTRLGQSVFYATLRSITSQQSGEGLKKVVAYIRKLTGCHPLAQSLFQLMCRNEIGTGIQKIALVEGLYHLFRELLPSLTKQTDETVIDDNEVFEQSAICWAYLITEAKKESSEHENFASVSLCCNVTGDRLMEPVRLAQLPDVFERSYVLQKLKDDEKIPNCTLESMVDSAHKRATDIEKMLLSLPPWMKTFPQWISSGSVSGNNFKINSEKTFAEMKEGVNTYPHLQVTPPLLLKVVGVHGPRLVFLEKDNLGVFISTNKLHTQKAIIFDCIRGKSADMDLDELSNILGDVRTDQTLSTSRTPHEAIMVLLDSSSSMAHPSSYSDISMDRLTAVKQLFDSFANRSMAYNFHNIIALVKFGGKVAIIHTFTENLPKFQQSIERIHANGNTPLYNALDLSVTELGKVKKQFPDCRLRVLCLTDGEDVGSSKCPVEVTNKLMKSNIVVDNIHVKIGDNKVMHAISNATGGCCFKPDTSAEALKLFEMETLLSLESRKLKPKSNSPFKTMTDLLECFATVGYDKEPERKLPAKINNKVTMTKNALKKKIQESKSGRFLIKDKRIIEELKSLHCNPHPYCSVFPSEKDISFWKIVMQGPPETPYENGAFELYCEFGKDYPIKPPLVRFITPVYHCNVNSIGRVCHNIFDRNYSAHITMREILEAIYGLLSAPEPEDPLDSVLAEEYMSSPEKYNDEAKKKTELHAKESMDDIEKKLVGPELDADYVPELLTCPLTKKLFVDPVQTPHGMVYERKAIEKKLKKKNRDPRNKKFLMRMSLTTDKEMKKRVNDYRRKQILETPV